jgi:hypothetical protein
MTTLRQQARLAGVALAVLAVVALWQLFGMIDRRQAARYAADDLAESRTLAAQIVALRDTESVASETDMKFQEIGQRIKAATGKARLAASPITGVYHQRPRRVGDSPYLVRASILTLRRLTLQQLVGFLYHLTDESVLTVNTLILRPPNRGEPGDQWDADVTLTYLIYAPPEGRGDH